MDFSYLHSRNPVLTPKIGFMDYLFIFFAQVLGVFFNTGKQVRDIDKRTPGDTLDDVWNVFLSENRVSIIISGGIVFLVLFVHALIDVYTDIPDHPVSVFGWFEMPYGVAASIISLAIGYIGQAGLYAVFGKAEEVIMKKVMDRISK